VVKCCEHGDEPQVSINGREFLAWLSTSYFLKKDSSMELIFMNMCYEVTIFEVTKSLYRVDQTY
jgi:hypothetical protein